jgi:hypothetical protein
MIWGADAHGRGVLERPPDEVRAAVRDALTQDGAHAALADPDRREIARSLVRIAHAAKLLDEEAKPSLARAMVAQDRYGGSAVANMADTARRTIQAISFPRFVAELIQGVFKAMLETNQVQLQQYLDLIRAVSQSLDGYSSLGGNSDDPAKRWLAEQFPSSYAIELPEKPDASDLADPDYEPEPIRLITKGAAPSVDAIRAALGTEADAQVPTDAQELIPFVKRSLAKNRQGMLATMVQMGMQRIVIDSGRISASMRFHIDATSAAAEQSHEGFDTRHSVSASGSVGFGPWSASASVSSTIGYVKTTDVQTEERTSASADLNSSVELHFRTDQVPLDRMASKQTVERLKLNTLNPEAEMKIAAETDRARIKAASDLDTARAKPRTEFAPGAPGTTPKPAETTPNLPEKPAKPPDKPTPKPAETKPADPAKPKTHPKPPDQSVKTAPVPPKPDQTAKPPTDAIKK